MLVQRVWSALQVSHSGCYSKTRWTALQEYQKRTSSARAFAVCIATPLPSLAFVILVEAIPLEPVAYGLRNTTTGFIRLIICALVIAFSMMTLVRRFIPDMQVTSRQLVRPAIATAIGHTAFVFGYSYLWVYPLPFCTAQTSTVFVTIMAASFVAFLGTKPFRDVVDVKRKLLLSMAIASITVVLTLIYPAYGMMFRAQQGALQMVIVFLPSLFKQFFKAIVAKLCRALQCDEFIPEVVHCGVEVAHALYVTTCLQTASAQLQTTLVIFFFDFIPLAHAYRTIGKMIENIETPPPVVRRLVQIMPVPCTPTEPTSQAVVSCVHPPPCPQTQSLRRALYACENHLLVEYVECVIPLLYVVYSSVLFYLPNAKYYAFMKSIQTEAQLMHFLGNIVVLVALQFGSMAIFGIMLSRRGKRRLPGINSISCLHVLAYVLETQKEMVQAWLFLWMPFCILSPIEQAGMDFTLRFEWVRNRPT